MRGLGSNTQLIIRPTAIGITLEKFRIGVSPDRCFLLLFPYNFFCILDFFRQSYDLAASGVHFLLSTQPNQDEYLAGSLLNSAFRTAVFCGSLCSGNRF